jgi:2-polyprenyl-3-methyl-5-hydroxy-6-metoxy-1,4-benzoquinol methylase
MRIRIKGMTNRPERSLVRDFFDTEEYVTGNPNIAVRSRLVRRMLNHVDTCSILDVGCGDGSLSLQFLPGARQITLVDLSEKMLDRARERTPERYRERVAYVNADILDFTPMQKYDIALCVGVLAHAGLIQAVLQKLSEALAPGGRCIVQISDYSRPVTKALYAYSRAVDSIRGARRYALTTMTAAEVIAAASEAGLELAGRENYSFQLPGSRLLGQRWRIKLEEAALRHPRIAAYGVQTMLRFVKRQNHVGALTAERLVTTTQMNEA